MEEKKENSKSRFLEFLNRIEVSQYKCAQMCGWASGYLTGLKGDFGADKLATIMRVFPKRNVIWLITGEGSMFNPEKAPESDTLESTREEGATIPFEMFMQTTNNYNKIIAEKDSEINALRQEVDKLKKQIEK